MRNDNKKRMNIRIKFIIGIMMCFLMLCSCVPASNGIADYDSVSKAVTAYRKGTDIVGKTIEVRANTDSMAGIIYIMPSSQRSVYIGIIANDENKDEVQDIKRNDLVVVTVDSVDERMTSISILAREYQIIR